MIMNVGRGLSQLPPVPTAAAIGTGLLFIPIFGWFPLVVVGAALAVSATVIDQATKDK